MTSKKAVLFGGTFDPVHLGHTAVAAAAAEHIGAEKVIFIPAKHSPLKGFSPKAGDADRLAMITLAIAGNEKFDVSDYELRKTGPSYTLETVRWFKDEYGSGTLLYWLMGADGIGELPGWYGITELLDECNLCVMYRGGYKPPDFTPFEAVWGSDRVAKLQRNIVPTPLVDISSTQIRNALAGGRATEGMLHPDVSDYIKRHGLYK